MTIRRKTPNFLWPPPSPPDPPDGYEIRCSDCDFAAFYWISALEHRDRTDHGNLTVHRTDTPRGSVVDGPKGQKEEEK